MVLSQETPPLSPDPCRVPLGWGSTQMLYVGYHCHSHVEKQQILVMEETACLLRSFRLMYIPRKRCPVWQTQLLRPEPSVMMAPFFLNRAGRKRGHCEAQADLLYQSSHKTHCWCRGKGNETKVEGGSQCIAGPEMEVKAAQMVLCLPILSAIQSKIIE